MVLGGFRGGVRGGLGGWFRGGLEWKNNDNKKGLAKNQAYLPITLLH